MLRASRSQFLFPMTSLQFLRDLNSLATIDSWDRLRLQKERIPGITMGIRARPARETDNIKVMC
jgi:hypothetical protein